MEQHIDFTAVTQLLPHHRIAGVEGYRTENGNWVEIHSEEAPEIQVRTALDQGATEICLKLVNPENGKTEILQFGRNELLKDKWSGLKNKRMAEKLRTGEAFDLRDRPLTAEGFFKLDDFIEDVDYCDAKTEAWIWSIGISYATGEMLASTSSVFYQNPEFFCLWLR